MIEDRARQEASDPATPLTRLHELAQERPDLRPLLAANPSTYPALLEWLARLGDPRVDAALRVRAGLGGPPADWRPVEPPAAAAGPTGEPPRGEAAWLTALHGAQESARARPAAADEAAPTERLDVTAPAAAPTSPTWEPATPTEGVGVVTATSDPTGRRPMWAVLGLVAGLLLVGLVWVINLRGQEQPAAGPTPPTEPTPTAEQPTSPPTSPTGEPEPGAAEVAGAQEALAALPRTTSCADPAADADVVAAFTAAAAPGGHWRDPVLGDALVPAMQGLQDACDPGYAVQVAEALESDPVATATLADRSTWLVPARPAPEGAQQLDAFLMPSRNISCTLGAGGTVTCTILERQFADPPGCGDGPVTVVVGETDEARVDCAAAPARAAVVLPYGASAVSRSFACTSDQQGVSCWSTITGRGFSLARAGVETY